MRSGAHCGEKDAGTEKGRIIIRGPTHLLLHQPFFFLSLLKSLFSCTFQVCSANSSSPTSRCMSPSWGTPSHPVNLFACDCSKVVYGVRVFPSPGWDKQSENPDDSTSLQVTVEEDSYLAHPTRDRAKIQHSRRPPTRGHLMAVASTSTSDGMLTLDLIQEEDPSPEEPASCAESFRVDLDKSVAQLAGSRRRADSDRIQSSSDRATSLPRPWEKPDKGATYTPQAPKKLTPTEKGRCASLEEILSQRDAAPARTLQLRAEESPAPSPPHPGQLSRIQDLVARKLEKTQELLAEVQGLGDGKRKAKDPPQSPPDSESEQLLQETERLLGEASSNWSQAKRVLQEVSELRDLYRQMDLQTPDSHPRQTTQHSQYRKSLM
ncbi:pleckstrin domain-containing family O member 1 [Marmota monax]|uniref:Pleckstrin domain-containing family O member 1 n=2 Tax=Marmota TaxID=9992 RepID=A0A834V1Y5_MARMO|nr:pleckstrin domain-containing family O member 1 [Marmota monax]KAF7478620.1 pleckstrin domain-containing family O member 1 [Marmota monax]